MNDCDCEKNDIGDRWLDKNDFGDEFLREESFKIIQRIERDKKYFDINSDAVFNQKLEQKEIDELELDEVKIDYSYLENGKFKGLEEKKEIELLEENIEEEMEIEVFEEEDQSEEMEPEWLLDMKMMKDLDKDEDEIIVEKPKKIKGSKKGKKESKKGKKESKKGKKGSKKGKKGSKKGKKGSKKGKKEELLPVSDEELDRILSEDENY